MADPKQEKEDGTKEDGQATTAESKNAETKEDGTPGPVPYDRFKEVNDKAKGYEARLAELEKLNSERESEEEKARQARLKEQEKYQELAQEWENKAVELQPQLDASKKELETLTGLLEGYSKTQVEAVPELYRAIVQAMPLADRLAWLTENADKLTEEKPGGIPATPKGRGKGELTNKERRARSARTF